jgi:oligoribonuclease
MEIEVQDKNKKMSRLFWIDLEMSGLDIRKEVIIEVGVIITDLKFNVLTTYETAVKQPEKYLEAMDDWNRKHHTASGLLELIPKGKTPEAVENDLISLVEQYFVGERPILAGNSIHHDRNFLNKYMPKFANLLHYRMIDVTSLKIVLSAFFEGIQYDKKNVHRSVSDIQESIEELKHYLKFVDPKKGLENISN